MLVNHHDLASLTDLYQSIPYYFGQLSPFFLIVTTPCDELSLSTCRPWAISIDPSDCSRFQVPMVEPFTEATGEAHNESDMAK